MQNLPSSEPFVEYVLKCIEHPPYMFVSKLAACCAMLFLTRSDPQLLKTLCHKWAVRFKADRTTLTENIRRKSAHRVKSLSSRSKRSDETDSKQLEESGEIAADPAKGEENQDDKESEKQREPFFNEEETVEHLLSILNALLLNYFSWNWHRTDYVIQINREYELYVREALLPVCLLSTAEEGVDDPIPTYTRPFSRGGGGGGGAPGAPSYLPSKYHNLISSPTGNKFFSTHVGTGLQTQPLAISPHASPGEQRMSHSNSNSNNNNTPPSARGLAWNDPRLFTAAGRSPTRSVGSAARTPTTAAEGPPPAAAIHENKPPGAAMASPPGSEEEEEDDGVCGIDEKCEAATVTSKKNGSCSEAGVSKPVQPPFAPRRLAKTVPRVSQLYSSGDIGSPVFKGGGALVNAPSATEIRLQDDVSDIPSSLDFGSLVYDGTLAFLTLCNYREMMQHNENGIVIIFHARYSPKSVEAVEVLQQISIKRPFDPMPFIAVVHSVAEPELASMYDVRWIPTVIYTPPPKKDKKQLPPRSVSQPVCQKCGEGSSECEKADSATEESSSAKNLKQQRRQGDAAMPSPLATKTHSSASVSSAPSMIASNLACLSTNNSVSASAQVVPRTMEMLYGIKINAFPEAITSLPGRASCSDIVSKNSTFTAVPAAKKDPSTLAPTVEPAEGRRSENNSVTMPLSRSGSAISAGSSSSGTTTATTAVSYDVYENDEGEMIAMIETDEHLTYPVDGALTYAAMVGWLESKGTKAPPTNKPQSRVTRTNGVRAEERFRRLRELHSAVVMLRRLQGEAPNSPLLQQRAAEAPMFIFLGGGMAAGKTTAAMALAKSSWWKDHKDSSVVVNADEFKLHDPQSSYPHAEAHVSSTQEAENLLVQALNQGRSIVFDSTMMWKPFIDQMVAMVRQAHLMMFKRGRGYLPDEGIEEYFVPLEKRPQTLQVPYKVHFLGITVEPDIAVPRGFIRKFTTGRGVPIPSQLRSFKFFAENFTHYVSLMDSTTLYDNNVYVNLEKGELPPVMAEMSEETKNHLCIRDKAAYQKFQRQTTINEDADNILEIYPPETMTPSPSITNLNA